MYIYGFHVKLSPYWLINAALIFGILQSVLYTQIIPFVTPDFYYPVMIYGLVISCMIFIAVDTLCLETPKKSRKNKSLGFKNLYGVVGAVWFGVSDLLLAYVKFVGPVPNHHLAVMGTYFWAQFCIAKYALGINK